jgi:hypothetical protein
MGAYTREWFGHRRQLFTPKSHPVRRRKKHCYGRLWREAAARECFCCGKGGTFRAIPHPAHAIGDHDRDNRLAALLCAYAQGRNSILIFLSLEPDVGGEDGRKIEALVLVPLRDRSRQPSCRRFLKDLPATG